MKTLIFAMLIVLSFASKGQNKVVFINGTDGQLGIVIIPKPDSSFSEYFVFQYENINFSSLTLTTGYSLGSFNTNQVVINIGDQALKFSLDSLPSNSTQICYRGFGFSHRKGAFKYGSVDGSPLMQMISSSNGDGGTTCSSGGPGSSECSTSSQVGVFETSCTVKCNSGYYACCNWETSKCKCIKDGQSPKD